jgi:hypothetical protein
VNLTVADWTTPSLKNQGLPKFEGANLKGATLPRELEGIILRKANIYGLSFESATNQLPKVNLIVHLTHSRPPPPWLSRGWQGAASSCTPAWPWMAAAPVKAPESLAESQMRQLDNQESES